MNRITVALASRAREHHYVERLCGNARRVSAVADKIGQ